MKLITQSLRVKRRLSTLLFFAIAFYINAVNAQSPNKETRPRIVVTADPELDDNNSLIRFLLNSCDLEFFPGRTDGRADFPAKTSQISFFKCAHKMVFSF